MGMKTPQKAQGQVGTKIPKVIFTRLDGKFFTSAKLKGKVAILDFWATWYPPCRSAIPALIELYEIYGGKEFEIVSIALDKDIKELKRFVKEIEISYPIVTGNKGIERAFGGIEAIPTTLLVDKKGTIRFRFVGYTPKEVFEEKIKLLLGE